MISLVGSSASVPISLGDLTALEHEVASGHTIALPLPAGFVAGQYAVAVVWQDANGSNPAWNQLAGWTLEIGRNTNGGRSVGVYRRILQGGDGTPTFVAGSVGDGELMGRIITFNGVDSGTPDDVAAVNSQTEQSTAWQPTGITTVTPNAWVVSICGDEFYNAMTTSTANGFTQQFNSTTASEGGIICNTKKITAAGATTMPSYTEPNLGRMAHVVIALRPS